MGIVFVLIAVRDIGKVKLQIWQVMLGGAIIVLLTGRITLIDAFHAIDFDLIFFLFGMFIIGQATEDSGYLTHLCHKLFGKVKSVDRLVLAVLFTMGLGAAVLMNDTIAIIGTPVMLLLSKRNHISTKLLLLCLAFGITIGSVMSPIGNLFILGAASNIIIIQHAEKENQGQSITFIEFAKVGVPLTMINTAVYWIFLVYL